jgi:hypothetical protein
MAKNDTAIPARFPRLFSTDSAKAAKASGFGYLNAIHYMAPHDSAGVGNLCSHASWQCIALCLGTHSGQAAMVSDLEHGTNATRESRKLKARLFMAHRQEYLNRLARDIVKLERQAEREGLTLCVRLNGSTDIAWERISFVIDDQTSAKLAAHFGNNESCHIDATYYAGRVMTLPQLFPHIQFVDYTKNPNRMGKAPANLHLTLSYSGSNLADCLAALARGQNVAVVFGEGLPRDWHGYSVIDGDLHDLRHLDPVCPNGERGVVVGLSPKGLTAKRDTSGFVVRGYHSAALAA